MTKREIVYRINTMDIRTLRDIVFDHFNIERLFIDLLGELSETKQRRFIKDQLLDTFSLSELEDMV